MKKDFDEARIQQKAIDMISQNAAVLAAFGFDLTAVFNAVREIDLKLAHSALTPRNERQPVCK